jgi:ferredoxin
MPILARLKVSGVMFIIYRKYTSIPLLILLGLFFYPVEETYACGGKDVTISDFKSQPSKMRPFRSDQDGNLLVDKSVVKINPGLAQAIAEKYVLENFSNPPLPLTFRKLEWVHRKLIYQFESEPLEKHNGLYHLGPVNFKVERLVLDVDAVKGNLHLANGCGAAPGKLLYKYDPSDFGNISNGEKPVLISNNTNFIARKTGNQIKIDGRISQEEWKNTGHRYFYLGTYKPHKYFEEHQGPYYYAEVWTQIDEGNIYFALKTDTPYWVGLMFKNDPNLGMLGAYRDAKVMKSNGEVSDRHFIRRPDKTLYLEYDETDHILSKGHFQNDFYTYEFAFPLQSGDSKDIQFEYGKAYNMLLVIGNTAEHYGIFTLDKAHANHAHSKNNEEHSDVWASVETTFRIGTAAERDIYGSPVVAAFAGYNSGFIGSKNNTHFHYVGMSLKNFSGRSSMAVYISWLSVVFGLIGVGIIIIRFRSQPRNPPVELNSDGFDLMKIRWVRRVFTWKHYRNVFIIPTLIIFCIIIYVGFFDVQDGQRNIATVFTWTLWWCLIIFTFIIAGRFWCMMCPFAAIGDLAQKLMSLNKKLPRWLQNMGLQTGLFVLLTWAFTILAFTSKPFVTAVVIVLILVAAVIFSIIYQRRSFCRHICPIGAVIGIYSMVSPIELRPSKEGRCEFHKNKTCGDACPMLESPYEMDNNVYCNFCMKCQPACASENLGLRLRSFGKDIYASLHKSPAEALAALFLLGVVIVETLAMTSSWRPMESSLSTFLGINSSKVLYTVNFSLIILMPVGVFYIMCYLLKLWLGKEEYRTHALVTDFAFLFIPLGIALHFAHNIQHLLLESPIATPATIRFLHHIGIGTSLSPDWNPLPIMGSEPIFFIQMSILMAGFGFTLFLLYRLLRRFQKPLNQVYKMVIAMTFYALLVVLTSIYMLGLPMSGRHIH